MFQCAPCVASHKLLRQLFILRSNGVQQWRQLRLQFRPEAVEPEEIQQHMEIRHRLFRNVSFSQPVIIIKQSSQAHHQVIRSVALHVAVQHAESLQMFVNQAILDRERLFVGGECVDRRDGRRGRQVHQQVLDRQRPGHLLHLIAVLVLVLISQQGGEREGERER